MEGEHCVWDPADPAVSSGHGEEPCCSTHDPMCAHRAPGEPCTPLLPWFTGPGSGSPVARFLIETKSSCKN